MELKDAEKFLEENDIKLVMAQFVDIHGAAKTKVVPSSHLEDIVSEGAGFAGAAIWGMNQEPQSPDFMAKADLNTLSLIPWMPGFARVVCVGHVNDEPYHYDSRYTLQRQIAALAQRGWTMNTGIEPEMNLLQRDEQGNLKLADETDTLEKPCYDYKGLARSSAFIEKFVDSLQQVGFDVYQIDHEDSNGQFEINYTYSDCLTSADRHVFVRMAASEIANQMGMICTFMPKYDSKRTGSGMHLHISIASAESDNIFYDDSDARGLGLSTTGYHFLGGIMKHVKALCALAAPTVNSYKRLIVGTTLSGATWAPAVIAYGGNNRSTLIRCPYGRIEFRMADGGCNPYLLTAGLIAAGLDGVENEIDPGDPYNINLFTADHQEMGLEILPQSLDRALDELQADTVLAERIGEDLVAEFIKVKRIEWQDYMRHVSDWEIERYLEFF